MFREKWHTDLRVFNNQRNSIASYCNNEMMLKQGTIENSDIFEYCKYIHETMPLYDIVNANIEKKRLGRDNDEGYVMISPFSKEKIAYSIGICDDTSWDHDMANNGYEIFQYDHTIKKLPEKNNSYHWKKQGITGGKENSELKQLKTMLHDNGHENNYGMVLKIDVEGYEWNVLENIDSDTLLHFDQIVMEIHHIMNYDKQNTIFKALNNLTKNHAMVHIHANNIGRANYCSKMITPDVLEVTMVKKDLYDLEKSKLILPSEIDQPNFSQVQEIYIGNWNCIG